MPKLSIVTPSFNYEWCIEDALTSVAKAGSKLPQGWEVEHVVVDDASSDGSPAILERWAPQLTLALGHENRGQSQTLNECLSKATGEWMGWLNADDFYLPMALYDACSSFGAEADIVFGDVAVTDKSARFIRLLAEHPFSPWTLRWWGTYLPVGAVFVRRDLLSELRWREDLSLLLDWDLWLRAAARGARFRYVPTPFAAIRRHDAQESRQARPGRLGEKSRVRREQGLPSRPWQWRAIQRVASFDHWGRKALTGAYVRQIRSRPLRHRTMRWFDDPEGWSAATTLYRLAYRRKVPDESVLRA